MFIAGAFAGRPSLTAQSTGQLVATDARALEAVRQYVIHSGDKIGSRVGKHGAAPPSNGENLQTEEREFALTFSDLPGRIRSASIPPITSREIV